MQDISIRHDTTLPVPYSITECGGYLRIEVNPAKMARIPIWLREIMENGALACITAPPDPGMTEPSTAADAPIANVIDIASRRRAV